MRKKIEPKRKPHERAHHPGLETKKKKPAAKKGRRATRRNPSPLSDLLLSPPPQHIVEKIVERMREDPATMLGMLFMGIGALLLSSRPSRRSLDGYVPRDFPQLLPAEIDAEFVDDEEEEWQDVLPMPE